MEHGISKKDNQPAELGQSNNQSNQIQKAHNSVGKETIFGTSHKLLDLLIYPALKATLPKKMQTKENLEKFFDFYRGSNIDTPLEGLLHIQLFAMHAQAMELLGEAQDALLIESKDKYLSLANRLTRTFTMALDALGKFKRQGVQNIRVERITLNGGSQAVIGNIQSNNKTEG